MCRKLKAQRKNICFISSKPAEILRVPGGKIKEGEPADFTVIDLKKSWTIDKEEFASKGRKTPFHGKKGVGMAVMTIVGGEI